MGKSNRPEEQGQPRGALAPQLATTRDNTDATRDQLQHELHDVRAELQTVRSELVVAIRESNALMHENLKLREEVEQSRGPHEISFGFGGRADHRAAEKALTAEHAWEQQVIGLESSTSYRLGSILVNAFRHPGMATLRMPFALLSLVRDILRGRNR